MKIEYTISFRRTPTPMRCEPPVEFTDPPPRIARLVALAHKLDALVRAGEVGGYADLARLGSVSPPRLTQIMTLLHLAPAIQESLLFIDPADARFFSELRLRQIAREPLWDRQQQMFEQLIRPDD